MYLIYFSSRILWPIETGLIISKQPLDSNFMRHLRVIVFAFTWGIGEFHLWTFRLTLKLIIRCWYLPNYWDKWCFDILFEIKLPVKLIDNYLILELKARYLLCSWYINDVIYVERGVNPLMVDVYSKYLHILKQKKLW